MYPYHILCWLNMIESYCIYRPFLLFLGNSRSNLDPIVDWYINTISPNIIPRQVFFLVPIFFAEKKSPTIPGPTARESTQALESVNEQLEKRIVRLPDESSHFGGLSGMGL